MKKILAAAATAMLAMTAHGQAGEPAVTAIPAVYDTECTASLDITIPIGDVTTLPEHPGLQDPFTYTDGSRDATFAGWERHRGEIIRLLGHYVVGDRPVTPADSISATMDADTLLVTVRNDGRSLTIKAPIIYPEGEGPFPAVIGMGWAAGSLPVEIFTRRGVACIAFNFNDVMSHTQTRGSEPINRLYPDRTEIGAYCAWPWGVSRLIDGLEKADARIDTRHLAVTGCSFAGKMALWSGAMDERIALTIAQEPGGGGAASWRVSETLGEVETVARTNYAWFLESMRQFGEENVSRLPVDHHQMLALVAPRAVLLLGNTDYPWLADESMYVSCRAAAPVWEAFGVGDRIGWSIEGGHPHCMLPESQIPEVEAFVDRYLLEQPADTRVRRAPMFDNVDLSPWLSGVTLAE